MIYFRNDVGCILIRLFFFRKKGLVVKKGLFLFHNIPLPCFADYATLRRRNDVSNSQGEEYFSVESEIWFSRTRHYG